jgi:transcriptional regulator with XRE-family HTH domain
MFSKVNGRRRKANNLSPSVMDATHRRLIARIQGLMEQKHWSANQLADFSGISRSFVSNLLNGKKSPTLRTLIKIADAFEIEVRELF